MSHTQTIKINGLEALAKHGVLPQEKQTAQRFIIDCTIVLERDTALDTIESTINYAEVCKTISGFTKKTSFDLIETLADKLCLGVLKRYASAGEVEITIKKPDAELPAKVKCVSVISKRTRNKNIFIGLGSNLGDREAAIKNAIASLKLRDDCTVVAVSSLYNTKPYGNIDQPDFLNGVLQLETLLSPFELLALLKNIEKEYGRKQHEKWGARELDLDLLFFGDSVIYSPALKIPHPDLTNRRFVLAPFKEIAPFFYHPVCKRDITSLLSSLKD